jgi:type I restriction enzyme, R subunit
MNLGDDARRLAAEARARVLIDRQLTGAGWSVQHSRSLSLFAAQGVSRREATMATGHGRADYLLYVNQKVVGVIEAKPAGTPLSGVEWQSAIYAHGLPPDVKLAALTKDGRLPFVVQASGTETHFTNGFDPDPRARRIFNSPKAATLAKTLRKRRGPETCPPNDQIEPAHAEFPADCVGTGTTRTPLTCANAPIQTLKRNSTTSPSRIT